MPRQASCDNRPFADLGKRLARKNVRLPAVKLPEPPAEPLSPEQEKALFDAAMADVVPLCGRDGKLAPTPPQKTVSEPEMDPDAEALMRLERLVRTGSGFVLAQTAEYVEGVYGDVPPEVLRRLHGGFFSVQGHVDLHGMDLITARDAFDRFMHRAITLSMRNVLVVHGRGRSSPGPPVLKRNLVGWLTRGIWKRWIIAFTSARPCDGGTGATYVLLRSSPRKG